MTGIRAEPQWFPPRPSVHTCLDVYYSNETDHAVTLKNPRLNHRPIVGLTNGVIWTDFYPCDRVEPGQTVGLITCLKDFDEHQPQTVTVDTSDGQEIECTIKQFSTPGPIPTPRREIKSVTFSRDFSRLFLLYEGMGPAPDEAPPRVRINNRDCTAETRAVQIPCDNEVTGRAEPGLLVVRLPTPAGPGKPVHIRLQFSDGEIAHCLLRASHGIFLDDFCAQNREKLCRDMNLDVQPYARIIGLDPACSDIRRGLIRGKIAAKILAVRRDWFKKFPLELAYEHLCTVATGTGAYQVYARIADAIACNPYEMQFSDEAAWVESEEGYIKGARIRAAGRPVFWIPEVFCKDSCLRMLEPKELRLLSLMAIGQCVKGINYYSFDEKPPAIGYSKSPGLLNEIRSLNADIRSMEPVLAATIHWKRIEVGDFRTGYRLYTLWAPDAASDGDLVVIARNVHYETSHESNELGAKPVFKITPKPNLKVRIVKPPWLTVEAVVDALTQQPVVWRLDGKEIEVDVGDLELGRILWIKNSNQELRYEKALASP